MDLYRSIVENPETNDNKRETFLQLAKFVFVGCSSSHLLKLFISRFKTAIFENCKTNQGQTKTIISINQQKIRG